MTLRIVDTSNNNAGVPDATLDCDGFIFKATEGVGYVDPDCNPSYQEAKAAGKLLGVYHFARPDGNDPISEAQWFLQNVQGYIGEAVLVLDWEVGPVNNVTWAKQWLDYVYNATGVRPMIYMNTSTANAYDWSPVWNDYALWDAQYRDMVPDYNWDMSNAGSLPDVKWPNAYAGWQWTSSGRLNGYGGNLDCSVFYMDKAGWKAFASPNKPNPVPVPTPPPAPAPEPTPTPTPEPVPVVIPDPTPVPVTPVSDTPTPSPAPVETQTLFDVLKSWIDVVVKFLRSWKR